MIESNCGSLKWLQMLLYRRFVNVRPYSMLLCHLINLQYLSSEGPYSSLFSQFNVYFTQRKINKVSFKILRKLSYLPTKEISRIVRTSPAVTHSLHGFTTMSNSTLLHLKISVDAKMLFWGHLGAKVLIIVCTISHF